MINKTTTTIPTLSVDLIDMLDSKFPERSPELGETKDDLMYRAGQRSVVRMLKAMLKEAEEVDMKGG
jgi:hypothetical protein